MNNNFHKYINNIRDIFKEDVQEPFYYDIKLDDIIIHGMLIHN